MIVVVLSHDIHAYEVAGNVSLQEVDVAPVANYLTANTHLLRVTSSLPAFTSLQQPSLGTQLCIL